MPRRLVWGLLAACCAAGLPAGCAPEITVSPSLPPPEKVQPVAAGRIVYDGNPEYLPRTIRPADAADEPAPTFRYAFDVTYTKQNVPELLALYSPATLVGAPIGWDTISLHARLEVVGADGALKRSYEASCRIRKTRNVFSEGETLSSLRHKGLIALRDSVEAQMLKDRADLAALLSGAGRPASTSSPATRQGAPG